jgi:hypothetical protein
MAGKMGLPQRTLQLLQRATSRRGTGEQFLQDAISKALRAATLGRSARVAQIANDVGFGMATVALALKALGLDPCDPLDWWDAIYLLPLFMQARRLNNRLRPPSPGPSDADKYAQQTGFDNYDEMQAWNKRQIIHENLLRRREWDKATAAKWMEAIEDARGEGVEDARQVIRLTDEGVDEMKRMMEKAMRENAGHITLEADVNDSMRILTTGDIGPAGANRFGSVTEIDNIVRGPAPMPGPATANAIMRGPAPPPGLANAGAVQPPGDPNEAPTVFWR